MPFDRKEYLNRQEQVRLSIREHNLDGLLLSGEANVRYLCGYEQQDAVVAFFGDNVVMVVGDAYFRDAQDHAVVTDILHKGESSHATAAGLLGMDGILRLGFDSKDTMASRCHEVKKVLGSRVEMHHADSIIQSMREIKSAAEQAIIMESIRAAERGFMSMLKSFSPLDTEKQAAAKLDYGMRMNGAEHIAFPVRVSYGVNTGVPHRMPSDSVMMPSDPVMYDFGAVVGHYNSDMTRMGVYRVKDPFWQDIFMLVMSCMQILESTVKPDMRCADAYLMAKEHMACAGGEFVFSLGHGIGLEEHEGPHMSQFSKDTFKAGQVICLEPGVYFYGKGCMRTEDMYLVTGDGLRRLTELPHAQF